MSATKKEPPVVETQAQEGNTEVIRRSNMELMNAELRRKQLLGKYRIQEKVPMYLSPMYRPYFGNVMRVMINGISIFFKVDGTVQLVPKDFADEITARRMAVDAILTKQNRMANIPSNFESAPGELTLF